MHMNIFDDDAFSAVTMTDALEDYDFQPNLISSMNLFESVPIATESISVERRANGLRLIPTSERASAPHQHKRDRRNFRKYDTVRIAESMTIRASEIQGIREFGGERDVETMVGYVGRYQQQMISHVEMTWENMRLGAVQGVVLDADGETVLYDWYDEWGIAKPAAIDFDLLNASSNPEQTSRDMVRSMAVASKGAFRPNTRVIGLAGDKFFDALTQHAKVREVYLNSAQAMALNNAFGVASQNGFRAGSWATFDFGGITYINYRGTDDFDSDATKAGTAKGTAMVGIPSERCRFFPMNAPGLFQQAFAPGESFEFVNTIGRALYSLLIRDTDRNQWVMPELYSYPIFICTRPEVLREGKLSASS